jgi:GTP-binding protein
MQAVATALRDVEEREVAAEKPQERRRYTLENVDERAWQAQRLSRHHFAVTGVGVERFTRMTDFGNDEAVDSFQRMLESSGISQELANLGVQDGDIVHIAEHQLNWGEQEELLAAEPRGRRKRNRDLDAFPE